MIRRLRKEDLTEDDMKYIEDEKSTREMVNLYEKGNFDLGKKEGIKEGEKKGEKKREIEMAKASIKEGLPTELISKLTGLSKAEITKLSETI